jgi:2-phosphosulfolactate phosphatase
VIVLPRWQLGAPADFRGRVVVVIDVLRWSTVVLTALANGAERVEAYATPGEAMARAAVLGRDRTVLGGERDSVALPGFDVGNSPREYSAARVHGKVVVTTTTNGTQALLAAREAETLLVGAFVNLPSVVKRLRTLSPSGENLTLVCAGQEGAEALEDTACAGAIVAAVRGEGLTKPLETGAAAALDKWTRGGSSPQMAFARAAHARTLMAKGFQHDLDAAARIGSVSGIAVRGADGALRLG